MQKSGIEWCDYTSNPVKGYCPMGCPYCYARKIYDRFKWDKTIRFVPEELEEWGRAKAGSRIFVGSTIELFHDKTIQYMPKIIDAVVACPQQKILLLTKQPQNLPQFSPFPDNCWVGVTITNQATLSKSTTNLGYIEAKVKFISFEPLLERLPLPYYQMNCDWVIIGACTGRKTEIMELCQRYPELTPMPYGKIWTAQPKIEWVEEIVLACDKAGVPVFLKDNLLELVNYVSPETEFAFNKDGYYRQEMPR